jgi:hypothetical protein
MSFRTPGWIAAMLLLVLASPLAAQPGDAAGVYVPVQAGELAWQPIQPPGFDAGMELAVVHGDPSAAGEAYTVRLRFPDGYRFPPHWHPNAENVTVLDGTFLLAMGETANESRLVRYAPGDYLFIAGRHPHFGGAVGQTVIQLHGMGPFDIVVVGSPEDDR